MAYLSTVVDGWKHDRLFNSNHHYFPDFLPTSKHNKPTQSSIERLSDSTVIHRRYTNKIIYLSISALTLLVGRQEGHPACKKLSGGLLAWLSVWSEVQTCIRLMPLPLTVSHSSKIQIGFTFLVPAHQGSPGQRAVKRMYVLIYLSKNRSQHAKATTEKLKTFLFSQAFSSSAH